MSSRRVICAGLCTVASVLFFNVAHAETVGHSVNIMIEATVEAPVQVGVNGDPDQTTREYVWVSDSGEVTELGPAPPLQAPLQGSR